MFGMSAKFQRSEKGLHTRMYRSVCTKRDAWAADKMHTLRNKCSTKDLPRRRYDYNIIANGRHPKRQHVRIGKFCRLLPDAAGNIMARQNMSWE